MRVAIIGAGAAGLASARHISAEGFDCEVFEMGEELGGTWVYTDCIRKDKYGYPVHTAMYKNLRANLPKQVMGFPDFPIPETSESFLSQEEILKFLNLYADRFNIRRLIKFNEMVSEIRPMDAKWQLTSIHKPTNHQSKNLFDAVMICTGHYHTPFSPKIPGEDHFKGIIQHSFDYRSSDPYKSKRVLVVGAGPSGLDIAFQISSVADFVVVSYHPHKQEIKGEYPSNVTKKPEISCIKNEEIVEFVDGSCIGFDVILYCTGYKYNFPFLHPNCGIIIKDNHVQPLYKHMIHIENPTMCFIGIPYYVCAFQMFDLQARFFCKYLNKSMDLPTKELMYKDTKADVDKRLSKGYSSKQMHLLGHDQKDYFDDLAKIAKITSIDPVITKIWSDSDNAFYQDLKNFRNVHYKILNKNEFIKCVI